MATPVPVVRRCKRMCGCLQISHPAQEGDALDRCNILQIDPYSFDRIGKLRCRFSDNQRDRLARVAHLCPA